MASGYIEDEEIVVRMTHALRPFIPALARGAKVGAVWRIHAYCLAGVPDMPMRDWARLDARALGYMKLKERMGT